MKTLHVGIQLYSVRDALSEDFEGTLRRVKELGYDYVEFAGYYGGLSGEELKELLDTIGLRSVSVHQSLSTFLEKGQEAIDFFKAYGVHYIVIPYYHASQLPGSDQWENTLEDFRRVGELCQANGMELLYHNHDFELEMVGERRKYDIMFEETLGFMDPQPDVCWLNYGGVDPSVYLRKYGDRIRVVHLKDFTCANLASGPVYALIDENGKAIDKGSKADNGFRLVPLGDGCNDFSSILQACSEIGAEYLIVEQDDFVDITPFDGMARSRAYLRETFGL